MNWFTGLVLYALIWWVLLFAVLPFGIKPQPDPDASSGWRGTPLRPMLGRRVLATTVLAGVVWSAVVLMIEKGGFGFLRGWLELPYH